MSTNVEVHRDQSMATTNSINQYIDTWNGPDIDAVTELMMNELLRGSVTR